MPEPNRARMDPICISTSHRITSSCNFSTPGPTEILMVADEHADPFTIATDLLSQAEHGPDSPAVLITTSESQGRQVIRYVDKLLEKLETAAIAGQSWKAFGEVIVVMIWTKRMRWRTSTPLSMCRS